MRGEMKLYLRGGSVIDPVGGRTYEADLLVEDGKIAGIFTRQDREAESFRIPEDALVLEAGGLMAAPGLADTHLALLIRKILFPAARRRKRAAIRVLS